MNLIKNNKFVFYATFLAFLGFIDAAYLTISHYKNIIPPCTLNLGCEKVLTSSFSMIGPIPLALLGAIFYLTLIIISLLVLIEKKNEFLKFFYYTVIVGFIVSLVLFLIQVLIIKSFCQYCLLSEAISTGILILAGMKYKQDKSEVE